MAKEHLHFPDWRSHPAMSIDDSNLMLTEIEKKANAGTIAPEQALEGAFFAFNAPTDYGDDPKKGLIFDPRIYSAAQILKYQQGAEIFETLSSHAPYDARVSFEPNPGTARGSEVGGYSETVSDYATTLKARAGSLVDEDHHIFGGVNTDHEPEKGYTRPDYKNSQILSGILFEEQSKRRGLDSAFRPKIAEVFPPLDIPQIVKLCRLQADLKEALEQNQQYSDKESLRVKLNEVHELLETSPEFTPERLEDLTVATAMVDMMHATVIQELGELSLDGSPEDFAELREHCVVLAIDELQKTKDQLTPKSTFEISTALAVNKFREIELRIDDEMYGTGTDLSAIRNDNRYNHDEASVKINLPKIDFSGDPLSVLPEIDFRQYIKTIPEAMGKSAVQEAVAKEPAYALVQD